MRDGTPVGTVRGSLYLPAGYIIADGSTVQRADYPRLVALANEHNLWRDETVSYTITGTTVAKNTIITAVKKADLAKIRIGDTLTARQLAAGTKVTAIDYAANTVTISVAATTAGTKISIDGSGDSRHEGLFGRGDGTTTLVLPNYINRMIQLAADNAGLYLDAGLANIVATCSTCYNSNIISQSISGAFYEISGDGDSKGDVGHWFHDYILGMNANRSNAIYGNSETVQPPAITLLPILRY